MDIDIDFLDRDRALGLLEHIVASRDDNGKLVKHNTGVYLHEVPTNAETGLCAVPYDQAEDLGYFKIDFLNVGLYKGIENNDHLEKLLNQEPLWDLLEQEDFVNLLFHVNGHADILKKMKPKNIEQLASVLAMIRPAKRHLIGKQWEDIKREIWEKPNNGDYYWKKSHAFAYAAAVIVQMNLICEQLSYGYS